MENYRVTASSLNVRNEPSTDAERIGSIVKDTIVGLMEKSTDLKWSKVKQDETEGWVFNEYLELNDDMDWLTWTSRAMKISGSFEGNGEDWGNPVGNFDDAYLTCGLLGFTWRWNNQPPMILEFVERKGRDALFGLMPEKGEEYYQAASRSDQLFHQTGVVDGSIVSTWSVGEHVKEPYRAELKAFWSCDEMKKIQTETALNKKGDLGNFAKQKTLEGQRYYNLAEPQFAHFAYWFDQAVLNGTGKTQGFDKAENIKIEQVFDWMKTETGYTQASFNKNRGYWQQIIESVDDVQRKMWILAYLRSDLSREEFDTVTMCRRGSLALGSGWINGAFRKFDFAPAKLFDGIKPNTDEFLSLARENNQELPAERLVKYKLKFRPDGDPRYWAIVDFNQPSTQKRLYVFDAQNHSVNQYFVAHGKGTDPNHDSVADVFSNVPDSNCSSLGIYRCAETYTGIHGLSLKLDGLESTNSNARDRAIVMHKAEYVSQEFIDANGKLGRSDGCFAVENAVYDTLIHQLENGSYLIAWKS